MAKPGSPSRFPQLQDREWLAERIAAGTRGNDIAAEIGCSSALLYQTVKKLGLIWPSRTAAQLRDREWLQEQYIDRLRGTTDIAAELKCSDTAVADALRRLGIPARTNIEGRTVHSQRLCARVAMPEAADLYLAGKSLTYLAERYDVSDHIIKRVLTEAGVRIRTKAETWAFLKADPEQVAKRKAAFAHRRRPTGVRKMKELLKQDAICAFCSVENATDRHHINAVRSDDRPENFAPLCRDCHAKVEWFIGQATNGLHEAFKNGSTELELVNE